MWEFGALVILGSAAVIVYAVFRPPKAPTPTTVSEEDLDDLVRAVEELRAEIRHIYHP